MIEEITIKFGMELKLTQHSWKSQLFSLRIKKVAKCHVFIGRTWSGKQFMVQKILILPKHILVFSYVCMLLPFFHIVLYLICFVQPSAWLMEKG